MSGRPIVNEWECDHPQDEVMCPDCGACLICGCECEAVNTTPGVTCSHCGRGGYKSPLGVICVHCGAPEDKCTCSPV